MSTYLNQVMSLRIRSECFNVEVVYVSHFRVVDVWSTYVNTVLAEELMSFGDLALKCLLRKLKAFFDDDVSILLVCRSKEEG